MVDARASSLSGADDTMDSVLLPDSGFDGNDLPPQKSLWRKEWRVNTMVAGSGDWSPTAHCPGHTQPCGGRCDRGLGGLCILGEAGVPRVPRVAHGRRV